MSFNGCLPMISVIIAPMRIAGYEFDHICEIDPVRETDGSVRLHDSAATNSGAAGSHGLRIPRNHRTRFA